MTSNQEEELINTSYKLRALMQKAVIPKACLIVYVKQ